MCGSCVAFATMNTVETCFKKLTGVFGDYAEQQFVDCAYGQNGANGCNGAYPHAYAKWAGDRDDGLAHESSYPYLNTKPKLTCPANLPVYNQGAKVSGSYYTYKGDEDLMKKLVFELELWWPLSSQRDPSKATVVEYFLDAPLAPLPTMPSLWLVMALRMA